MMRRLSRVRVNRRFCRRSRDRWRSTTLLARSPSVCRWLSSRPRRFRRKQDFDDAEAHPRAARAFAYFPAAFEPEEIVDGAARLAGFTDGRPRWAIDGGLLENAPIGQAIDFIPLRPASGMVKR